MTDTHGSHDAKPDNHADDMATTPPNADTGVTAAEAAVLLGISERTVLRRLKQGKLRAYGAKSPVRCGKSIRDTGALCCTAIGVVQDAA